MMTNVRTDRSFSQSVTSMTYLHSVGNEGEPIENRQYLLKKCHVYNSRRDLSG